jgi:hypothetical protein
MEKEDSRLCGSDRKTPSSQFKKLEIERISLQMENAAQVD